MRLVTIQELEELDQKHQKAGFKILRHTYGVDKENKSLNTSRALYYRPRALASEEPSEHVIDEYCAFKYY